MKMEYVNVNGYLIPKLENGPITDNTIGKYGMMRARYLDEHRPMERDQMLLDGTLAQHLTNIDCEAHSTLTAQRRALYRGKSKTTPADYSEQIQALTARIRELRREITTCADIEMDCEMVQDKVQRAAHRRENPPRERIHRRAY